MAGGLFYNLGRKAGPAVRKARWFWGSLTATDDEIIRLEHDVGLDLAREVRGQIAADDDPATGEVLNDVGSRLAGCVANKRRSFHFEAFSAGEPNAFALPGGFVFVSRPIIDLCQGERDELAFVLGHEMGHIISGHAIERIVTNSAVSVASRTAAVRGLLGGWLRHVGVQFLETAYSRDHELEADRLGVRLAAAAGYDPQASIRLLERLAELKTSAGPLDLGEYFSTHPTFDLRIRNIRQFLRRRQAR
ncbi:MAG TPA: M48 family metallopeptidase [Sedimentisphaerales bacterium]|nr:M48 family metallopeptidase [Sedimentisphaerales bacterium]HRS11135.1 M48 family metallopeptidase [Sedimentisphaerales bacterium]HRV47656.1 M48 family metallopeptidase [Sedimentisphaerales bacterium]